jgi:DNA polymerase IV
MRIKTLDIVENRKIIHIDMDAFYASVEQRDFPEYRGKPLIVGGAPDKRGVVAACSYEARKFGIHSAMPSSRAYRLCPQAIFQRPRFDVYRLVSTEIAEVFQQYTDKIEPLSLDEAYLDVTDSELHHGSATLIARSIKQTIKEKTRLTASAGVSYNKFLAKMASDMDKPDGLYVILPEEGADFIAQLPIGKFYGIGKATEAKMLALDIHNGAQLKQWPREKLVSRFGKAGNYYFDIAQGIDNRPVVSTRIRKSLGTETTFEHDLGDKQQMLSVLNELADKVVQSLLRRKLHAKTITIKVKYTDFTQVTRSMTLEDGFNDMQTISPILPQLLDKTEAGEKKVRLLGVTTSNFIGENDTDDHAQIELI